MLILLILCLAVCGSCILLDFLVLHSKVKFTINDNGKNINGCVFVPRSYKKYLSLIFARLNPDCISRTFNQ